MLGNLIGGFIVILVGASLAPTVANEVKLARFINGSNQPSNISGAPSTIFNLVTLFYCLSIATAAIGIATLGLRNAGLM